MMNTDIEVRTLTIVLPEADWRELRAREPDAIGWLQAQIRKRLEGTSSQRTPTPATVPADAWDDY